MGKKGPSSPGEGPSPSDAVLRPSSTDAVEGSTPTDEEEKDGEKELSSQLSKKTAAVKEAIGDGKMAVVDIAAVTPITAAAENISSAAEEADGKMAEVATDIVDQDLDDKMSEEDSKLPSSLPTQPAIITSTSSCAASSAEPSTLSSAKTSISRIRSDRIRSIYECRIRSDRASIGQNILQMLSAE